MQARKSRVLVPPRALGEATRPGVTQPSDSFSRSWEEEESERRRWTHGTQLLVELGRLEVSCSAVLARRRTPRRRSFAEGVFSLFFFFYVAQLWL